MLIQLLGLFLLFLGLHVEADSLAFAKARAPLLRFDQGAGGNCFPDEALDSNDGKCRDFNKNAPIYYDFVECGNYAKLVWWMWYGWQKPCTGNSGKHGNDWEHITTNFFKKNGQWQQDSVTRFQHGGWFTRQDVTKNPWIFVGKVAHGSYDVWCDGSIKRWLGTHGCSGGCGYWEDYRNVKEGKSVIWKPHNIKHISEVKGTVSKRVTGEKYFNDPKLNKCNGPNARLVGTSGCWRNNHVFPAPVCDYK